MAHTWHESGFFEGFFGFFADNILSQQFCYDIFATGDTTSRNSVISIYIFIHIFQNCMSENNYL
jgi:hypothetical protein